MTIARGQLIIDQYHGTFEGDDEIMLFQILADLLEWCDAKKVDFQVAVEDAQEHLRQDEDRNV